MYVVQICVVGGAGKNSLSIETAGFRKKTDAMDYMTEALITNANMDPDLAMELVKEWEDSGDSLEWSVTGPRQSSIIHRLECVDIE